MRRLFFCAIVCLILLSPALLHSQTHADITNHVRGEMSFLAGPALRGRGSATRDEWIAAAYVAAQFQSFGLDEAQVQRAPLKSGAFTYNAVGVLRGADPELSRQTILLSSHLDHLGARQTVTGEVIYPGADDDASGTTAVIELARFLGARPRRPRRTMVFVCFGSEETGGQGNRYFLDHPPLLLSSVIANLEFEMIGLPDNTIRSDQLWLSGWERTNLGPVLAKHGAPLVADPHPQENFFQRSDNFQLARRGVVAQTISSYGLGAHYHAPSDDLSHIDFEHLAHTIEWMIAPIEWLASTDWKPAWNPGMKP
jgi:Zn-dependent M28 family amino/carboxypeptidase